MADSIGFVVLEYNQASHQPSVVDEDIYDTVAEADDRAKYFRGITATIGRQERHVVAELVLLPDDVDAS